MAGSAVLAGTTGDAWFDRDAVTLGEGFDAGSERDDLTSGLMAEDERLTDDVAADAAMLVVVDVRGADAHRPNANEHLAGTGIGQRHVAGVDLEGFFEVGGLHSDLRGCWVVGRTLGDGDGADRRGGGADDLERGHDKEELVDAGGGEGLEIGVLENVDAVVYKKNAVNRKAVVAGGDELEGHGVGAAQVDASLGQPFGAVGGDAGLAVFRGPGRPGRSSVA